MRSYTMCCTRQRMLKTVKLKHANGMRVISDLDVMPL